MTYEPMREPGARVIQVVETTLDSRGDGNPSGSPFRRVTQYWSLDGRLLAEVDQPAGSSVGGSDVDPSRAIR